MNGSDLPIDLGHWALALSPLLVLLVLLVVLRWKAPEAGPIGLFVAAAVALLAFRTPIENVAVAGGKGIWDAVFILFVIWPALLLYRVVDSAGGFASLRSGIERFTRNELFLVVAFGWVFASFLQGIAGFGAPIAVVAPLLVAIGVRPVYAVVIPLIGHAWANMFGTLAVGWLATIRVVDLENQQATAVETAILLWIPNLLAGFAILWLYGRWSAIRYAWSLVLIVSAIHGGGQLLFMFWNPVLSNFLAASLALVALYPISHWGRYSEPAEGIEERPAMRSDASETEHEREEEFAKEKPAVMGLGMALLPYAILTVASVALLVPEPVREALDEIEVGLPFPAVDTGYGVETEAEEPYSPFAPLTHPGSFLLFATAVSWGVYRARGYFEAWAEEQDEPVEGVFSGLLSDATPASIAVVAFLAMSTIMGHSGQTDVLAGGVAEVAPPTVFAFLSGWIGVLGAFMTSSNTASNILFAPLQQGTVQALEGLRESTMIAAQSTGGAIGNAIAPANVVLGTGTAGIVGQEGAVLRITLVFALAAAVLTGIGTVALNAIGG